MDSKIFRDLGISENEIKIYLQLLKSGPSSTGPIIEKTKIASSRVYTSLASLVNRGLVSFHFKNNTKYYRAEDPALLLQRAEEIKENVARLLPELQVLKSEEEPESHSSIFDGFHGFKTAFFHQIEVCSSTDEILVIGFSPQAYAFSSLRTFLKNIDRKRIGKKISMKILLPKESKNSIGKDREKEPRTRVRYLSRKAFSPAAMNIFKDYVSLSVWEEKPTVFQIKNKKIAESFRQYFQVLWTLGK